MRGPRIQAVGMAIALTLAALPAAVPVIAAAGTSGLFLDGEPGDWVSGGDQWAFVEPGFTITTGVASPDHNFVSFGVQGQTWGVSIDAPAGEALTAGTSFPAKNGVTPAGTGILWVTGDGRGCTLADGSVTVGEVAFDHADVVSAFAADFWMDCDDGNSARLYGSIRYHSSISIRAITLDVDSIDFGDTVVGTPSANHVITIANEGTSAVQFSDPTFAGPDAGAFDIVGTPCAVVLPGNDCTVSVRVDTTTRGPKHADLIIPDSTFRGQRRIPLSTTAYQTTTTKLVVVDMDPDVGFGPVVTVTVSPNPGPLGVSLTWTGGGGPGDPGNTGGNLDPLTGAYANVPLGIGPGTWAITASFPRQDYFEASTDPIVDLDMPLTTWLSLTSNSPSVPGASAILHASVNTVFSEPLVPGTVTIRDAANAIVASGPVGGATVTVDGEVCCLATGDYDYTATYVPDSADAFGSSASWTHVVRDPVPSGILYLEGGAPWTSSPVVPIHFETSVLFGTVTRMQVTNDGIHWHDHDLLNNFDWDLTDPAVEGTPFDGRHIVSARWATADSEWGPIATASIELDRGLPSSSVPSSAVTTSATTTGGAAPVALAWSGTDDRSGVDHYVVERSTDGGTYAPIVTALPTSSIKQLLASGHSYRFRVQAVDAAGNAGIWTYGSTINLKGVSQSSAAVHYAGTWSTSTNSIWWGGTARSSSTRGSTVSYAFTGKSIAWVGLKASTRGKAYVYINGVLKATVDLYSTTTKKQVVVWSANFATSATRTITIKVLGTSGRPRVDVDGFLVGS